MILFRQKYPRWWFDWNLELLRFSNRVGRLPRADATTATRRPTSSSRVHLDIAYPDAESELNRWLPLVKWFLAIPHYIVLFFLYIARVLRGDLRLVRDPVHRPLPAAALRLRRGRDPLAQPRDRPTRSSSSPTGTRRSRSGVDRTRSTHRPPASIASVPVPQPRSRTRWPGPGAACSISSSLKRPSLVVARTSGS